MYGIVVKLLKKAFKDGSTELAKRLSLRPDLYQVVRRGGGERVQEANQVVCRGGARGCRMLHGAILVY